MLVHIKSFFFYLVEHIKSLKHVHGYVRVNNKFSEVIYVDSRENNKLL